MKRGELRKLSDSQEERFLAILASVKVAISTGL